MRKEVNGNGCPHVGLGKRTSFVRNADLRIGICLLDLPHNVFAPNVELAVILPAMIGQLRSTIYESAHFVVYFSFSIIL
jgi:hypothetical protein